MRQLTLSSCLLFALVYYALSMAFGSEFMLVAESRWVLKLIALLMLVSALLAAFPALAARPGGGRFAAATPLQVLRVLWGVVAAVGLLALGSCLVLLLMDALTGPSRPLLAIVAMPFAGFAVVLAVDAVRTVRQWVARKASAELPERKAPGCFQLHTMLAIAAILVALRLVTFDPQWSDAVAHEPVFERGDQEGRGYRIPSLLSLPDDTLLAFAESRANAFLDWGDIDLVMRRGEEGGASWGPIETLVDAGDRTAGNPCPVYDRASDTIFLPYTIDNKTLMLIESRDGGRSWSEPRNLTAEFGLGEAWTEARFDYRYGTGPGVGLQLSSGRLIVPAYHFDGRGAHVLYSDDHGRTWRKGDDLGAGGEPQVVELSDGRLLINARNNEGEGRLLAFSDDGGESWHGLFEEVQLPAIGVMSPIVALRRAHTEPGAGGPLEPVGTAPVTGWIEAGASPRLAPLLFASPSGGSRGKLTIKRSDDDGASWHDVIRVYNGPSAYSSLGILSDGTVLLLAESGRLDYRESITLVRVPSEVFPR